MDGSRGANRGALAAAFALVLLLAALVGTRSCLPVWLAYILPSSRSLWERIHCQGERGGGLWRYKLNVHSEIVQVVHTAYPRYSSLLDVACNLGFMLGRLQALHPAARHYGSDISLAMIEATQRRCAECVVGTFDVQRLQAEELGPTPGAALPPDFPPAFDVVVVSDVLYYMAWGGWPPAALQQSVVGRVLPRRRSYERFARQLSALARRAVVFSDHQGNAGVMDFFRHAGVVQVGVGVWVLNGTAPAAPDQADVTGRAPAAAAPSEPDRHGPRRVRTRAGPER